MQNLSLKKILFVVAVAGLLLLLLPIEYKGYQAKTVIYALVCLMLPVLFLKFLPAKESLIKTICVGTGLTVYFLVSVFLVLVYVVGLCAWVSESTEYVSKQDESTRIMRRGYGCFGTDEDYYLFKEKKLSTHISWVTEFNENPVDTGKWK